MSANAPVQSKARLMTMTFGAITAVLLVSAISTERSVSSTLSRVETIVGNGLESVRLLGEMESNFHRQLRLIDAHVFEATGEQRQRLEQTLDGTRAEYARLASEYAKLTTFPGEAALWSRLQGEIEGLRVPMDEALSLSRSDRDAEARLVLRRLGPAIDLAVNDIRKLVDLNAYEARISRDHIRGLLSAVRITGLVAWGLGVLATVAAGIAIARLVARLDARERAAFSVLETRNRELDAFAGRLAHDLRGPLSAINASASLLAEQLSPAPIQVASIRRGVTRMNAMVSDLLELSRIEGPSISESCDPAPAVIEFQESAAERLAAIDGQMRVDVAPARVGCREGLLRQVVANLGENALTYRREGVKLEVQVTGRVIEDVYELRISDNGIGMSTEEASRAFDPLFRARRLREAPGTGLGLSIVKRIVESSGGSITVDSKLGQGTTMVVRLPLRARDQVVA